MSDEVYMRDFTLVMAHSFVGLGFCTLVALRTASLSISMPFSLLSRFLSFYKFSQALLGAPFGSFLCPVGLLRVGRPPRSQPSYRHVVFFAVQTPFILLVLPSFAWRTMYASFYGIL